MHSYKKHVTDLLTHSVSLSQIFKTYESKIFLLVSFYDVKTH